MTLRPRHLLRCALLAAMAAAGCSDPAAGTPATRNDPASPDAPSPSTAPAASASPASSVSSPSLPASSSGAPRVGEAPAARPPSVADLRAAAERDPARFDGQPVSLEVVYVRLSQRKFGNAGNPASEHVGGILPVVHVALEGAPDDVLECQMGNHAWPPIGLQPGDPLTVKGVWSFDRIWAGGTKEGGGPLHVGGCAVARRDPAVD